MELLCHQVGDSWCLRKGCGQGEGRQEKAMPEMQRAPGRGSCSASALRSLETAFAEGRSPQPRVNVHSSAHVPRLQESGPGERGPPNTGGEARQRSQSQLGRKKLGGSSALNAPPPPLRGCSEPLKVCARQAHGAPPPRARRRRVHRRPPRPAPPAPGARSRSPLTRRLPPRGEGTQDALRLGLSPGRGPGAERPWKGSRPGGR